MSDTVSTLAAKIRPFWLRDLGASQPAASGSGGMIAHALNGPYHTGTLDQSQAPWALTTSRTLTAGSGLTGGGDLSADRSFAVGAGLGITVNADDVALASTVAGDGLTYSSGVLAVGVSGLGLGVGADAVTLTSSSNPGAAASILASSAAGLLTLQNGAFTQAASSAATFASGFAGSGWRADYGITTANKSTLEVDDLTVRGRMRVYELMIQQIRATNGSLLVSSSSKVVEVVTTTNPTWLVNGVQLKFNASNASLTTTIYTISTVKTTGATDTDGGSNDRRNYHGFLYGDIIRAQQTRWNGSSFAGTIQSDLEVTAVASLTSYNGTLVSGDAAAVGYDYVRLGSSTDTSRQGVVYLTSDDSAAPFIDIADNILYHSNWNSAGAIKARLGKLTGISDSAFGGALSGYGLYSQNVYLRGQIVVTGGSLGGLAAADVNSNTTTIDGGRITANSVTASQIAAGTITSDKITVSTLSALAANMGTLTAGSIVIGSTNKIWLNDSADGALNIGGSTKASAPFQVTAAGALTATSATVTGSITASSGGISGNFYVGSDVGASGNLYVGSNADIRLSGDGIRLVLPNLSAPALSTMVPTNSSALRWFSNIGSTWTNAANYTGQVSYRDTSNKVVDWVAMSFVGSTDYATYYARSMLYAYRWNGSSGKECRIEATVDPGTGGAYVTASCDTFYTSADAYIGDDIYIVDNCSALTFTDRTPHYNGDALAELRQVRGNSRKGIDHSSLPAFARKQVRLKDGGTEEGRDLGAMISILTVAVQQLDARLDALEGRGNGR